MYNCINNKRLKRERERNEKNLVSKSTDELTANYVRKKRILTLMLRLICVQIANYNFSSSSKQEKSLK